MIREADNKLIAPFQRYEKDRRVASGQQVTGFFLYTQVPNAEQSSRIRWLDKEQLRAIGMTGRSVVAIVTKGFGTQLYYTLDQIGGPGTTDLTYKTKGGAAAAKSSVVIHSNHPFIWIQQKPDHELSDEERAAWDEFKSRTMSTWPDVVHKGLLRLDERRQIKDVIADVERAYMSADVSLGLQSKRIEALTYPNDKNGLASPFAKPFISANKRLWGVILQHFPSFSKSTEQGDILTASITNKITDGHTGAPTIYFSGDDVMLVKNGPALAMAYAAAAQYDGRVRDKNFRTFADSSKEDPITKERSFNLSKATHTGNNPIAKDLLAYIHSALRDYMEKTPHAQDMEEFKKLDQSIDSDMKFYNHRSFALDAAAERSKELAFSDEDEKALDNIADVMRITGGPDFDAAAGRMDSKVSLEDTTITSKFFSTAVLYDAKTASNGKVVKVPMAAYLMPKFHVAPGTPDETRQKAQAAYDQRLRNIQTDLLRMHGLDDVTNDKNAERSARGDIRPHIKFGMTFSPSQCVMAGDTPKHTHPNDYLSAFAYPPLKNVRIKMFTTEMQQKLGILNSDKKYDDLDLRTAGNMANSWLSGTGMRYNEMLSAYLPGEFEKNIATPEEKTLMGGDAPYLAAIQKTGDPDVIRGYNTIIKNVADTIASNVWRDYGRALVKAFPNGIRVKEAGKEKIFFFDETGNMYRAMNYDNPRDTSRWQLMPADIFSSDSPYLRVLQDLSNMLQSGGLTYTTDTQYGLVSYTRLATPGKRPEEDKHEYPGSDEAARLWGNIRKRIESTAQNEFRNRMTAIVNAPFDIAPDPNSPDAVKWLLSEAIHFQGDPAKQPQLADRLEQIRASGGNMANVQAQINKSIKAFNNFRKFVLLELMERNKIPMYYHKDTQTAKREILADIEQDVQDVHKSYRDFVTMSAYTMPKNVPTDAQVTQQQQQGWGSWIHERTLKPIHDWMKQLWHQFRGVVAALMGMVSSGMLLNAMKKNAKFALGQGAAVAFQVFAFKMIDEVLKDPDSPEHRYDASGNPVSFHYVREAARSFAKDAVNLPAYTRSQYADIQKWQGEFARVERRENSLSPYFHNKFDVSFADESDLIRFNQTTGGLGGGVSFRGHYSNRGTGSNFSDKYFSIDIPIKRDMWHEVGLDGALVEEIKDENDGSAIIYTTDNKEYPTRNSRIHGWWAAHGQYLVPTKIRDTQAGGRLQGQLSPNSGEESKIYVDEDGNPRLRIRYHFGKVFQNKMDAYNYVYAGSDTGRRRTASAQPSWEAQERQGNIREVRADKKLRLIKLLFA